MSEIISNNSHETSDLEPNLAPEVAPQNAVSPHETKPEFADNEFAIVPFCAPKPSRERFSTIPDLLMQQAQRIETWHVPDIEKENDDRAAMSQKDGGETHLLIFARDTKSDETVDGCEIVAYPCDANGRVRSWNRRYVGHDVNFSLAAQKLRFRVINDLAMLHLIENL